MSLGILAIRHATTYRYRCPVTFGPHRLLLRPRDGHDLRLLAAGLDIAPAGAVAWGYDVLGNSVAVVTFPGPADELRVVSRLTVERRDPPRVEVAGAAASYPFAYPPGDRLDLGRMLDRHHPDPADLLGAWARDFVLGPGTGTLALLGDLNAGIRARFAYQEREEEGTRTPVETLREGSGSCRDFAVLLAEAARGLGLGARVVSGYLHTPPAEPATAAAPRNAETTHAWTEIFVPGPGWIAFDPTNGTVGGADLVPVAVGLDMDRIVPVSGTFAGSPDDFLGMEVEVAVRSVEAGVADRPSGTVE